MSGILDRLRKLRKNMGKENEKENSVDKEIAVVKLLLVGSAESGKTTIFKKIKMEFDNGFYAEEIKGYRCVVFANTICGMLSLIDAMREMGTFYSKSDSPASEIHLRKLVSDYDEMLPLSEETCAALRSLFQDRAIQTVLAKKHSARIHDNAQYLLDNLDRISAKDYIPNTQDVLWAGTSTTSLFQFEFETKNVKFRVMDVGGMRAQQKKWQQCFEGLHAVIYVVALSEYNQTVKDDPKKNKLLESLELFEKVCNNANLSNTTMIVTLNKKDLFEEKLAHVSLKDTFPEYEGEQTLGAGSKYIEEKFAKICQQRVYTHSLCAIEPLVAGNRTRQMEYAIDAAIEACLQTSYSSGLC